MNPATITLIIALVQEAIKAEPAIAEMLKNIFNKPNPTPADWLELKARVLGTPFEALAPDAKTE